MILILAGEFMMGSNDGFGEKPVHKVFLDSYYIYKTPVTVKKYLAFCAATGWSDSSPLQRAYWPQTGRLRPGAA